MQVYLLGAKVMERHVLSVLVKNSSGVLTRVSGLFARRGFNIDSLTVGSTENPNISRMTITLNGNENHDVINYFYTRKSISIAIRGDAGVKEVSGLKENYI